jgi:hypothetical protein
VSQPVPAASAGADDYEAQLAKLGLRVDYLHDAVRGGEEVRRLVTANDPRNAAGTMDYYRRVRVLRDRLINEEGWRRAEVNQLPLVVNPDKTLAIGVLLGDYRTGWVGSFQPRSKRPVGEGKLRLVAQNQQLALIPAPVEPGEVALEDEDLAKMQTWFYMTYRRVFRDVVRVSSELSLPAEVSLSNYVEKWARRIPVPDLEFQGVIPYIEGTDDGPDNYDVPVDEK